ncbi:hypothetical protein [Streptomyces sp. SGAir0957]
MEPDSIVGAIVAAGVAMAALLVFVGTMPRRQPQAQQRASRGAGGGE